MKHPRKTVCEGRNGQSNVTILLRIHFMQQETREPLEGNVTSVCQVHPLSASLISEEEGGSQEPPNWFLKPCRELGILHTDAPCLALLWRCSWENGRRYQSLLPCFRCSVQFHAVPRSGWQYRGRGRDAPALIDSRLQPC